jgi:acyl carrier protein phosphodiesterase
MNFLAHLYLSGTDTDLRVGNFIGDFVKGKNIRSRFEGNIAKGIELHRAIDFFTDLHPIVKQSKNRLRPKYRHYSGIIVDIFYDHFLARNWLQYSSRPLAEFAEESYRLLHEKDLILPEEVKHLLPYMVRDNWLVNYARIEGIEKALSGMARRTVYVSKMNESVEELRASYEDFQTEFQEFFPILRDWTTEWIKNYPGE